MTRFGLKDKAEALGATVALLEGPGTVDVGAAGPHRRWPTVPTCWGWPAATGPRRWWPASPPSTTFRCWSSRPGPATTSPSTWGWTGRTRRGAWTRCGDGVELRIDLGFIAGRPFVNNASFGAYAAVVQSPAYRDDKRRTTTLDLLPGLLAGQSGPRLVARAGNVTVEGPQAVLVCNNVYGMGDIAGLGRRARLDRGTLGMFAVTVNSAAQAAGLLRGRQLAGADQPGRPRGGRRRRHRPDPGRGRRGGAGRWTPRCAVPSSRPPCGSGCPVTVPGCPIPSPIMDWKRLWQMALTGPGTGGG